MDDRLKKSRESFDRYYSEEVKRNIRGKIEGSFEGKNRKHTLRPIMAGASLCIVLLLSFVLVQAEFKTAQEVPSTKEESVIEASAFTDEDYEQFAITLTDFELPKEGRLSDAEALEVLGDRYKRGPEKVVYENGYVIVQDSKTLLSPLKNKSYPTIDAYGSQVLSYFKTELDLASRSKVTVDDHRTAYKVESLDELTRQDRESLANGEGFTYIQKGTKMMLNTFGPFVDEFSEEGYDDLAEWTEETVGYFEKASQYDQENWEKAYALYVKGLDNVDRLKYELNHMDS